MQCFVFIHAMYIHGTNMKVKHIRYYYCYVHVTHVLCTLWLGGYSTHNCKLTCHIWRNKSQWNKHKATAHCKKVWSSKTCMNITFLECTFSKSEWNNFYHSVYTHTSLPNCTCIAHWKTYLNKCSPWPWLCGQCEPLAGDIHPASLCEHFQELHTATRGNITFRGPLYHM